MNSNLAIPDSLYAAIHKVIKQARQQVRQAVNQQMVQAYWHIGRLIVEQEQRGQEPGNHVAGGKSWVFQQVIPATVSVYP